MSDGLREPLEGGGLREQLAAILREHSGTFIDQDGDTRCECGKWLEPGEHEWDWHVSGLVVEALGLREEFTWSWDRNGATEIRRPGFGFSVPSEAEARAEADPYMSVVRRWVSAWSVVDGDPK